MPRIRMCIYWRWRVIILLASTILMARVSFMTRISRSSRKEDLSILHGTFPPGFEWGVATSAYQVEGSASSGGKGPSIWDTFTRKKGKIKDGSNGSVACDSYHKYKEDVALVKSLGMTMYRFSISWSRLMPDGTTKNISEAGIQYYNNLVDELLLNNIKPIATLYHWDLPDALQKSFDGWLSEKMVDVFGDYADLCFRTLGDRVKHWITINEPRVASFAGYESGTMAPGMTLKGKGAYKASYTMLKAHARAYHIYQDKYKAQQNGKVAITLNCDWGEPLNENDRGDSAAADRYMQWFVGIYAHPIYHGDWPEIIKETVAARSKDEGLKSSRLPEFSEEEIDYIKGTNDFFALNTYTSRLVTSRNTQGAGFMIDRGVTERVSPEWRQGAVSWLYSVPWGMRKLLKWIKDNYPQYGEILITENGYSTSDPLKFSDGVCDSHRIDYYEEYINNVLKAIQIDKVNVTGYTAWSLMDNFEWYLGYTVRFGIHYVNFTDPERRRVPKSSAVYLRQLVDANGFPSQDDVTSWKIKAREYCRNKGVALLSSSCSSIISLAVLRTLHILYN